MDDVLTPRLVLIACCDLWNCSVEDLMSNRQIARTRRQYALTAGLRLGLSASLMAACVRIRSVKDANEIARGMESQARVNQGVRLTLWSIENYLRQRTGDPNAEMVA